MILEKEAVINHIASVSDVHLLANDLVNTREQIEEMNAIMRDKDREIDLLFREKEMLLQLVQALSRTICGKE